MIKSNARPDSRARYSIIFVPTMNGLILDLDFPGQTFPSLH